MQQRRGVGSVGGNETMISPGCTVVLISTTARVTSRVRAIILGYTKKSVWGALSSRAYNPLFGQAQCELKLWCLVEEVCHLVNAFVDAVTNDQQDKTAEPQVSIHAVDKRLLVHVVVTI